MKSCKLLVSFLLLLQLASTVTLGQTNTAPPTVVLRVNSIDALIDHVKFLVGLAGQKDAARQIEALIKAKIGDKGLEGLDSRRPFGFYGRAGKDLEDLAGTVLLPVADEKAFLNLLKNLDREATKGTGGVFTIKTGYPIDLYLRFANRYAYVTAPNTAALEDKNLLDPARVLAGKPTSAFALTIQLDQVPATAKQITTITAEGTLQDAQEAKIKGETKVQKELRAAAIGAATRFIAEVLRDGKELMTEVDLDQQSGDLAATFSLSGRPGSDLARDTEVLAKHPSQFAGILKKNAAFNGLGHVTLPTAVAKAVGDVVEEARRTLLDSMPDAAKKPGVEALFAALRPTFTLGDFDGALVATSNGKQLTLLTAFRVEKGDELGKTLHEVASTLLTDLPPAERAKNKLGIVDNVGPTTIYELSQKKGNIPVVNPSINMAEALFGELNVYAACTHDTMFLSLGKDGLAAIKEAIPIKPSQKSPMVFYEADVSQLIGVFHPEAAAKAKSQFPDGRRGIIRVTVVGGSALTFRLDTNVAVLRFLGQLREMKGGAN